MTTTTVVIGDSEPVAQIGLRTVISACADLEFGGQAANDADLASVIDEVIPQLVITEVLSPGIYGIEVIRACREKSRATSFLIFSSHDVRSVVAAFRAGACGYVSKQSGPDEVKKGIEAIRSGGTYIPNEVLPLLMGRHDSESEEKHSLTCREREVLRSVAGGHSNRQVAGELGIATRTVEAHRSSLMRKLGLHNSAEITRYAIRAGIVEL